MGRRCEPVGWLPLYDAVEDAHPFRRRYAISGWMRHLGRCVGNLVRGVSVHLGEGPVLPRHPDDES